jgi:hypothetical protein
MTNRHCPPAVMRKLNPLFIYLLCVLTSCLSAIAQDATDANSAPNETVTVDVAQAKSEAERLLPSSAMMYMQIAPVELWAKHPLRDRIFESEPFQQLWDSPQVLNARTALVAGEWAMGMKLETLAKRLTTGGVYIALDPDTEGIAMLMRTRDDKWLQRTMTKFLDFARNSDANKNGQPDIQSAEYKGLRGYKFQEARFAQLGPWLLVTNKNELAKSIVDRYVDGSSSSLADAAWRVSSTHGPDLPREGQENSSIMSIATAEVDLGTARKLFASNDLFRKQAKDFGAELLLGGILELLQNAPSVAVHLRLEPDAISTDISFPTEMQWFEDSREHYVGPRGEGKSLPLIAVDGSIASLSTYRNLSEMWLRAGDLFDQQVNDQLAQADNTLTTLFSGRDFGSDILGAIEPEIRMVAAPQTWESDQVQPSVKLPAFAMIGKLKDPRTMQKEMKRIFQSFIGFLNVVGAMEGQPQLDLMSETSEISSLYWGEYVVDADRKYENGLPIQFNFSPALAFVGDHIILSSTTKLAKQLILHPDRIVSDQTSSNSSLHTEFVISAESVQQALEANRDSLIAQNMLEKGHSRVEAVKEIDTLMGILELLDQFKLEMAFKERSEIKLRVNYR